MTWRERAAWAWLVFPVVTAVTVVVLAVAAA